MVVVFHNGLSPSGAVELPIADHAFLPEALRGALGDGVVLTDQLGRAGLAPMTIQGGRLRLELPATSAVILTLR